MLTTPDSTNRSNGVHIGEVDDQNSSTTVVYVHIGSSGESFEYVVGSSGIMQPPLAVASSSVACAGVNGVEPLNVRPSIANAVTVRIPLQ